MMREKYGSTGHLLIFGSQTIVGLFFLHLYLLLAHPGVIDTVQRGLSTEPNQLSSSSGLLCSVHVIIVVASMG